MTAPARWHRFVEHTGEVRLQVRAESLAGLLAEAGRALGLLLAGESTVEPSLPARHVDLRSHDREALLVDWLNEILFLAETELWVPAEIEVVEADDCRLRASVRGAPVAEAPSLVKAATLHQLRIEHDGDGVKTEVVLDV
jgi:SHS2 domain-containing protein